MKKVVIKIEISDFEWQKITAKFLGLFSVVYKICLEAAKNTENENEILWKNFQILDYKDSDGTKFHVVTYEKQGKVYKQASPVIDHTTNHTSVETVVDVAIVASSVHTTKES